jgi:hypothetical protein
MVAMYFYATESCIAEAFPEGEELVPINVTIIIQ